MPNVKATFRFVKQDRRSLQRERVYKFLEVGDGPFEAADEGQVLRATDEAVRRAGDGIVGVEGVCEYHSDAAVFVFWLCSLCYVADARVSELTAHVASARHMSAYLDVFERTRRPEATVNAADNLLQLQRICRSVQRSAASNDKAQLWKLTIDVAEARRRLGLSFDETCQAPTAAIADSDAAVRNTNERQELWCSSCWLILNCAKPHAWRHTWQLHTLEASHLDAKMRRRSLQFDEGDIVDCAEATVQLKEEEGRRFVGLRFVVELADGASDRRRKQLVCLLCADSFAADEGSLRNHVLGGKHHMQFLHKCHPAVVWEIRSSDPTMVKHIFDGFIRSLPAAPERVRLCDASLRRLVDNTPLQWSSVADCSAQVLTARVRLLQRLLESAASPHRAKLDASKPLVGVEHVCEVLCADVADLRPTYFCRLCPQWAPHDRIVNHLESRLHKTAFVRLHDREALDRLKQPRRSSSTQWESFSRALDRLVADIIAKTGRKECSLKLDFQPRLADLKEAFPDVKFVTSAPLKSTGKDSAKSPTKSSVKKKGVKPVDAKPTPPSRPSEPVAAKRNGRQRAKASPRRSRSRGRSKERANSRKADRKRTPPKVSDISAGGVVIEERSSSPKRQRRRTVAAPAVDRRQSWEDRTSAFLKQLGIGGEAAGRVRHEQQAVAGAAVDPVLSSAWQQYAPSTGQPQPPGLTSPTSQPPFPFYAPPPPSVPTAPQPLLSMFCQPPSLVQLTVPAAVAPGPLVPADQPIVTKAVESAAPVAHKPSRKERKRAAALGNQTKEVGQTAEKRPVLAAAVSAPLIESASTSRSAAIAGRPPPAVTSSVQASSQSREDEAADTLLKSLLGVKKEDKTEALLLKLLAEEGEKQKEQERQQQALLMLLTQALAKPKAATSAPQQPQSSTNRAAYPYGVATPAARHPASYPPPGSYQPPPATSYDLGQEERLWQPPMDAYGVSASHGYAYHDARPYDWRGGRPAESWRAAESAATAPVQPTSTMAPTGAVAPPPPPRCDEPVYPARQVDRTRVQVELAKANAVPRHQVESALQQFYSSDVSATSSGARVADKQPIGGNRQQPSTQQFVYGSSAQEVRPSSSFVSADQSYLHSALPYPSHPPPVSRANPVRSRLPSLFDISLPSTVGVDAASLSRASAYVGARQSGRDGGTATSAALYRPTAPQ